VSAALRSAGSRRSAAAGSVRRNCRREIREGALSERLGEGHFGKLRAKGRLKDCQVQAKADCSGILRLNGIMLLAAEAPQPAPQPPPYDTTGVR
jgi:hypothetical protein